MRAIPQVAVDKAKELEELELRVYDDQQPRLTLTPQTHIVGKLTAGYGHTGGLSIGMTVTEPMADDWLINDDLPNARLELYGVALIDAINALTDNQYAALLLFCLNVGADATWTIWKRLNAKEFDQVPVEMMRFVYEHRNGVAVKVEGLVKRRAAEVILWSTGEPGSVPEPVRSSVTRDVETPPVNMDPTPIHKQPTVLAGAAAAVAGAPQAIRGVSNAIAPYSTQSDVVAHIVGWLALVSAILVGATFLFMYLKKKQASK